MRKIACWHKMDVAIVLMMSTLGAGYDFRNDGMLFFDTSISR